jgi:hypothetical protein
VTPAVLAALTVWSATLVSMPSVAQANPAGDLLLDTVSGEASVTAYVEPKFSPQIGQSFAITEPVTATSFVLQAEGVAYAKKLQYLNSQYDFQHFVYRHAGESIPATTLLRIWRSNDGAPIPDSMQPPGFTSFDVATDSFTQVYSRSSTAPIKTGAPFALAIEPPLHLDPGNYLAAWAFEFPDKRIFNVMFLSAISGTSAYFQDNREWIESVCSTPASPDTSLPGTSAYVADQWAPPGGIAPSGPFPGTIGFTTWFRPTGGKQALDHCPAYTWADRSHPDHRKAPGTLAGDLDLQIYGTRP